MCVILLRDVHLQEETLVPPAAPLAYSQIPFYLTNLVDTPIIVKMIKVSRLIFSFKFSIFFKGALAEKTRTELFMSR